MAACEFICEFSFVTLEDLVAEPGQAGTGVRNGNGNGLVGQRFTLATGALPVAVFVRESAGADPRVTLARPLGLGAGSFPAGSPVEILAALRTATTTAAEDTAAHYLVLRVDGVNLGLTGPALPRPGESFTAAGLVALRSAPPPAPVAGLVAGTQIDTPDGARPIEQIAPGNRVLTDDGQARPVVRTRRRRLSLAEQIAHPGLRPLTLAPGTAGNEAPLDLAPGQRLMLGGWRVEILYGRAEALLPAAELLDHRQVRRAPLAGPVVYHRLDLAGGDGLLMSAGARLDSSATEIDMPSVDTAEPAAAIAARLQPAAPPLRPYQARHLRGR